MQEKFKKERIIICKTFGKVLKRLRESTGKSLNKTAHEVELSTGNWSKIERGLNDTQLTTLYRLSEAIEIPLSQIFVEFEKELPVKNLFIEK